MPQKNTSQKFKLGIVKVDQYVFYHNVCQTSLFFARKIIFKVVKQVFYFGSTSHNKFDQGLAGQGIQLICHLDQIGSVNGHEWYHQPLFYTETLFSEEHFFN